MQSTRECLTLTNTLGRKKELFRPREAGTVRIFTCGPSTYRRPHIGNYRSFTYEDLLVRYLEYLGYTVHRVINFTDVEDKTVSEAAGAGESIQAITGSVQDHFFDETALLKLKLPEKIPRATESVETAVRMIQKLVADGFAYEHDGKYYFRPVSVKNFGRLYGLDTRRMPKRSVRFGFDTYEGRRWNLGDFVLWHPEHRGGVMPEGSSWDTVIGRGRPGWNIQDPAMIIENLGDQIDIQCGGIDNLYRHHDYNIAVMEAYTGKDFARYFLHGEHLYIDGEVMSKSAGNVTYPEHLIDAGYEPRHLRYMLMSVHYRSRMNFTAEAMKSTAAFLDTLRARINDVVQAERLPDEPGDLPELPPEHPATQLSSAFEEGMNDDLSAGRAIDSVNAVLARLSPASLDDTTRRHIAQSLRNMDEVLQILG
ncbi:MAG: class I tRNA ligase family protein [Spirochaetaceae bacterium]